MSAQNIKYYCDNSFHKYEKNKWEYLLDYIFNQADQVEFNILRYNEPVPTEISAISDDLIGFDKRKHYCPVKIERLVYNALVINTLQG
jgi:hypothetical protein